MSAHSLSKNPPRPLSPAREAARQRAMTRWRDKDYYERAVANLRVKRAEKNGGKNAVSQG